jgi:large subunit ribosomal protein L7/L12
MPEEKKISSKLEKIAKDIESLNIVELSELSKYLEDKLGVSAMAATTAQPTAGAQAGQVEPQEEKTIFTVVLSESGNNKLAVIKAVREIDQALGLMEAKKLVESTPKEILKDVKKEQAEDAKKKLEAAGAKVELK